MSAVLAQLVAALSFLGADVEATPDRVIVDVRYYVIVFAAQDEWNLPQNTHSWAAFAAVTEFSDGRFSVHEDTISWLPANYPDDVRLWGPPVCGRIYSLRETLDWMELRGFCVRHWGPCEIDRCLYDAARRQLAYLRSGAVRYEMMDALWRLPVLRGAKGAIHCVHSLTDVVGYVPTGTTRGHASGELVYDLYSDSFVGRPAPAWLFDTVVRPRCGLTD
jgi:hypothetical protein